MLILLGFSFLAGLATIISPCIWPLLPIILATSSSKGHKKPLGITLGLMLSFTAVTLAISFIIKIFHLNPNVLRFLAVAIIFILGLSLLIPRFGQMLEGYISKALGHFVKPKQAKSGFISGFVVGFSLGIIWAPCAGPILATIAVIAAMDKVNFQVLIITVTYVIGTGMPLFIFAWGGQKIITASHFLNRYSLRIQQIFGVIMILTALLIYTNYDTVLESKLLNTFPNLSFALNSFENSQAISKQLDKLKGQNQTQEKTPSSSLFNTDIKAPEFIGITNWLNTDKPITLASLKGKVVLVDFWTYSCINCIRTLPHLKNWWEKYKNNGFVVIGVETPEFAFEKETSNVEMAIRQFGITYPVAQDNNYATWNAYNNQYWPAEYLIDAKGIIRRVDFGEGNYTQMEEAIRLLLISNHQRISPTLTSIVNRTPTVNISNETYFGSNRMMYFYPNGQVTTGIYAFSLQNNIPSNYFSFGGKWNIQGSYAVPAENSTLIYNFTASKVYMVANPENNMSSTVEILLDGKKIPPDESGADVSNSHVTVNQDRLYNLINLGNSTQSHILKLKFNGGSIQLYTFTFG